MSLQRFRGTFAGRTIARWLGDATYLPCSALLGAIVAASTAITGAQEAATAFNRKATVPANTLLAGTVLRIRAQGIATATTGTETYDLFLKIGTVTIASKVNIDAANNDGFWFDQVVTVRDIGATGHIVAAGTMAFGASGTAAQVATLLASAAIDTTADLDITVVIDRQAAATDGDSARLDLLIVEIIG